MSELVQAIINYTLLGCGFGAAAFLIFQQRRTPIDPKALTQNLVTRACPPLEMALLLSLLLVLYFMASFTGLLFTEEQIPIARLIITWAIYTLFIAGVATLHWRQQKRWKLNCGLGKQQWHKLALAPLFYLATIPFLMLATTGYHFLLEHLFKLEINPQEVVEMITEKRSWIEILYILTAIFGAPIYEEILFRGIAFPFLSKQIGPVKGALLISALFALMHAHIPSIAPLFLLSAALCWIYWRTGSLWPCIGMHAIFNAISILAMKFIL